MEVRGPGAPASLKFLRQRTERRELLERAALLPDEGAELGGLTTVDDVPDPLQRIHLEREDRIAIDDAIAVPRPALRRYCRQFIERIRTIDLLDTEIQRAPETTTRRIVRTWLLWTNRYRRRKRVDERQASTLLCRPSAKPPPVRAAPDP